MCTDIKVMDQFLLNILIVTAEASHHCNCFQFPVIKFTRNRPKYYSLIFVPVIKHHNDYN